MLGFSIITDRIEQHVENFVTREIKKPHYNENGIYGQNPFVLWEIVPENELE